MQIIAILYDMAILSLLSYHNYLGTKENDEVYCRRHLFAAVTIM